MKKSTLKNITARRRRGLTLAELMITLIIFALISTAATSMLVSGANAQRYVMHSTSAVSQAELAFRRIVENLRSASTVAVNSATDVALVTQPDTGKTGNPVYNVQYTLVGTQLIENDDRFGSNVLATGVSTFSVIIAQSTKPTMFRIKLTVTPTDSEPITREAYVTSRNF